MITEEDKDEITQKVLRMLEKQPFADWYVGQFEDYLTGDMKHETKKSYEECKEIITKDLKQFLFQ